MPGDILLNKKLLISLTCLGLENVTIRMIIF